MHLFHSVFKETEILHCDNFHSLSKGQKLFEEKNFNLNIVMEYCVMFEKKKIGGEGGKVVRKVRWWGR